MKFNKIFSALMLIAAVAFTACENPEIVGPGPNGGDNDKPNPDTTVVDTTGWNIPAEAISVAKAREIAGALESEATTGTKYYIMGYVKKLHSKHADGVANYGNAQFYMEDVKGANSNDDFMAYQVYGPNGEKITDAEAVAVGDFVVIYGELTNYNGTLETVGKGAAYIWKSSNPKLQNGGGGDDPTPGEVITAAQAIEIANALEPKASTSESYELRGKVTKVQTAADKLVGYGNINFELTDNTGTIGCYYINYLNNEKFTSADQILVVGDSVVVISPLKNYVDKSGNSVPEAANGYLKAIVKGGDTPNPEGTILCETLLTQASFDKFTVVNVKGEQVWNFSSQYGAKMSGYNGSTTDENEDWFISPAMDLAGRSAVTLTFNHAFGPSVPSTTEMEQYTVWVSNDFDGENVTTATWTQITGMAVGTAKWQYVSSGELAIPAENLKANCRIAWKYTCTTVSATWEIKEVVVK